MGKDGDNALRFKIINADYAEAFKTAVRGTVKRRLVWDALTDIGHEVLGVPFGGPDNGRDSEGEAFHEGTDVWLNIGDTIPVTYYHGFGPDTPYTVQNPPAVIGEAKLVRVDNRGYWFRVRYNMDEPLAVRVMIADTDKLRASSGAVAHLVRVRDDGMIDVWPLGELAIFDTNEWRQPANDYAVVVNATEQRKAAPKASDDAKGDAALDESQMNNNNDITGEVKEMTENKNDTIKTEAVDEIVNEPGPMQVDMNELINGLANSTRDTVKAVIDDAIKQLANEPPINYGAALTVKGEPKEGDYRAKFDGWLRGELPLNKLGAKAVTEGGTGTALVPVEYGNELVRNLQESALFRTAGARVVTRSVLTAKWPKVGSAGYASAPLAEGGAYAEEDPTLSEVQSTLYKYGVITKVSEEVFADSRFSIWNELLLPFLSEYYTNTENNWFTVGSGSGEPQGIINANVGVTAASASAITADEIISLYHSLDHKYRVGAVWMLNDSTAEAIRKLKTTDGQYLWQPGLAAGQPDRLLGRPVITNNYMPIIAANAKTIVFGDFRYYWVFQHPDTLMQRLDELYAATGHVGFRAYRRFDGRIMNDNAFTVLQMGAV